MTFLLNPGTLLRMARQTVRDPRTGARTMMELNLPRPVLWQFFLLTLVISAMMKVIAYDLPVFANEAIPEGMAIRITMLEAVVGLLDDFEQYILAFLRRFLASYLLVLVAYYQSHSG